MKLERCFNCKYYHIGYKSKNDFGYCKFNPPVYVGNAFFGESWSWPDVSKNSFCSKFTHVNK